MIARAFALAAALSLVSCASTDVAPAAPSPEVSATTPPLASSAPPPAMSSAPPSAPPPAPIDGALPAIAIGKDATVLETYGQRAQIDYFMSPGSRMGDGSPVGIEVHGVTGLKDKGASEVFPYDERIELYGVGLEGKLDVAGIEEKGKSSGSIGPWQGFRAKGAGVEIAVQKGASAKVLLFFVKAPPLGPVAPLLPDPERPGRAPKAKTAFARKVPISLFDLTKQADLSWGGGANHARIGWEDPSFGIVIDALVMSKDSKVAEHTHDASWECLYLIQGEGDFVLEGEARRIGRDARVCVPMGKKHAWIPTGKEPLVAVQVYAPPGPEQRFKHLR